MAVQLTNESTSVVRLAVRSVTYRVPGRRRDGTVQGTDRVKRTVRAVLLAPLALLSFPVVVILGVLDDMGIQVASRDRGKLTVQGTASCAALSFADAVRDAEHDVWLVWSRSWVSLLTVNDEHGAQVRWKATGQQRPKLRVGKTNVRWPDDSRVDFDLTQAERARVTETQGSP